MQLGAFSISLAVKDLAVSRAFYEKLGFRAVGGETGEKWLMMQNDDCVIGLFEGLIEKNILTFNPGWVTRSEPVERFTDVRELQRQLKALRVPIETEADEAATGPASFVITDPDGNPILIDQHR
ncbi:VOC family protein [Hoeflea olei]|uniref:Glyoxalase n=1 Tax=Hoeflea olei TaxID=1480615 RepID=A0A1C1YW84_9HYPH|nr:VOC family protein [Hoeflea olei]OCW57646.1 glyoxalase [Hoeflea olei]